MALGTFSKFYFDYEITSQNNKIGFSESAGFVELTAELDNGIYTPTDLAAELKTQMDAVGTRTYTVTFNRSTRTFTITANTGTIRLLITTATTVDVSVYPLIGFTGADLTGALTYTGNNPTGSVYYPQYWLQDYTSPTDWLEKVDASINQAASGEVEVVYFGEVNFTEFNNLFITNLVMDNRIIKNNPTGVLDANDFMEFAIKRGGIEFMPNKDDVNTFYKLILESTEASSKGIGYRLKEETSKNLPGIYQSGKLKWRVLT